MLFLRQVYIIIDFYSFVGGYLIFILNMIYVLHGNNDRHAIISDNNKSFVKCLYLNDQYSAIYHRKLTKC